MNREILIAGLLMFSFVFLMPPWKAEDSYRHALDRAIVYDFGFGPSRPTPKYETVFRPIWSDGRFDGYMPGAEIRPGLWLGLMAGVVVLTVGLSALLPRVGMSAPTASVSEGASEDEA